jgi:hypothetical protein
VSVDGQPVGNAPLRVRSLQPGRHSIDLEAPAGYFSRRVEVDLSAGEARNIRLSLEALEDRAPPARKARHAPRATAAASLVADRPVAAGSGTLMIGSKPPCDIYIDGKSTGLKTPQRSLALSAGTHGVTLTNGPLHIKKKFKVKIATGQVTRAIQDLTRR